MQDNTQSYPIDLTPYGLVALWRLMKLSRGLEEQARSLYRSHVIPYPIATARGSEAVTIGATSALARGDVVASGRANIGAYLVRGIEPATIMSQWFGCGPWHMSQSLFGDMSDKLIMPAENEPGVSFAQAAGAALGIRMRHEDRMVLSFNSPRDKQSGIFYEALQFVAKYRLPIICLIASDPFTHSPTDTLSGITSSIDVQSVDGNDLVEIHEAVRLRCRAIREGGRPAIIEARIISLNNSNAGEDWQRRDPIERFTRYLVYNGLLSSDSRNTHENEINSLVNAAVTTASSLPKLVPGDELASSSDTFSIGPYRLPATITMSVLGEENHHV
jgi:TPP-dependent pyruvate/acetoin dehydrogenase alpha subunit